MSVYINSEAEKEKPSKKTKSRSRKGTFRLNSAQVFFTFSRCDLEPKVILEHLEKKRPIKFYIIAQENHKDEGKHIHAYIKFMEKPDTENARYFDIISGGKTYHPEMETVRSKNKVMAYVTKDGNYITNLSDAEIQEAINAQVKVKDLYTKARKLAREDNVHGALEVLEDPKVARDMTLYGNRIASNLRDLVPENDEPDYKLEQFNWDFDWNQKLSLLLWGPTNTGKTSLARALLPKGLLISHKDDLKKYSSGKYFGLIFDDMDFIHWPQVTRIHLTDVEQRRSIDVKHGKEEIPKNTPRIFTNNKTPREFLGLPDDTSKWIDDPVGRRCCEVFVPSSLKKVAVVPTTTTTTTSSYVPMSQSEFLTRLRGLEEGL